ncbi:MAG: hypothetical protein JWP01_2702 [Myxococcales bacterium]|nr:hypothetical protein [Myxococcales bacterium]
MRTEIQNLITAIAVAVSLLGRIEPARACGPDFPPELLADRTSTLFELHEGAFLTEVTKRMPAPAMPFVVVSGPEPKGVRTHGGLVERLLYEQGAKQFTRGDLDDAARTFSILLALPPQLRPHRSTWAAYMLGRIQHDGPEAIAAYQQVRALTKEGFVDELGLAAASLGQEARIQLDADNVVGAVHLYAEQASHGDPTGATSLLFLARVQAKRGAHTGPLLADPVGQQLLAVYLFTRADELEDGERELLWRKLASQPHLAGADRLAAAAYREGRWELARHLARRDDTATLSRWVLAKLALRDGDAVTGERLLAEVSSAMTAERRTCADEATEIQRSTARVHGELAVIAIAAGRPLDAMTRAWTAREQYPVDAVYLAERILTIDELRAFVDRLPPDPIDSDDDDSWAASASSLRHLLARRLMRVGRFAEAPTYFPPGIRDLAGAFATALERGAHGDPIDRARGLYDASVLARAHGLEILGTESGPDWAIYGAAFDPRSFDADEAVDANGDPLPATEPRPSWISDLERTRVTASAPRFAGRYHYRYLASDLAERAANLLPRQSQAFAATLCHAARYVEHDDRARFHALYRRYVMLGARVEFAVTFGQSCPEPEIDRARRFVPHAPTSMLAGALASASTIASDSPDLLALASVLALGMCAVVLAGLTRRLGR